MVHPESEGEKSPYFQMSSETTEAGDTADMSECPRCGTEHEQNEHAKVYAACGDSEGFLCSTCSSAFAAFLTGELHPPERDVTPPTASENECERCGCGHDRNLFAACGDSEGWLCETCSTDVAGFLTGELHPPEK